MDELELQRAAVQRTKENSARLAQAYATFSSQGQGSIEFPTRIDFGLTFIEKPYVSYCPLIDLDALGELLDNDPAGAMPVLPIVQGFVTAWDQDDRDFYTGAWAAARIWWPTEDAIDVKLMVAIEHHFTFAAIAIKDVPVDVRD